MSNKVLNFQSMMMKKESGFVPEMSVKAKGNKGEIILYAGIGDDFWGDGSYVSARDFDKKLKELPSNVDHIELRLNSPGGSVFDGITIYERLKQHKAKVTVYVDGLAASIASVIALAGDEVIIGEGAFFMIHQPMTWSYGNVQEHERTIDVLSRIENQMMGIYLDKTDLTRAQLLDMISKDTWINSDEAIEWGFADKKSESGSEMSAVASALGAYGWLGAHEMKQKIENDLAKAKSEAKIKDKINQFLAR